VGNEWVGWEDEWRRAGFLRYVPLQANKCPRGGRGGQLIKLNLLRVI
jgi:hypothetical protein